MTGSARRAQLVRDLGAEGAEQIEVAHKERQMGIVRDGVERVHFQRKPAPILEKLSHHGQRQLAFPELSHEGAFVNLFVSVFVERRVKIVDVGFGFMLGQSLSRFGLPRVAHVCPPCSSLFLLALSSHYVQVKLAVLVWFGIPKYSR